MKMSFIKGVSSILIVIFILNYLLLYSFAPQCQRKSKLINRGETERIIKTETKAIQNFKEIKIQKINKILSGILKNKGEIIVKLSEKYNINPYVVTAIMIHETANGRSNLIVNKNNPGGLTDDYGNFIKKDSLNEGIEDTIKNFKIKYIDCGLDSLKTIQPKYAPIGAKNDPKKLNRFWLSKVQYYYDLLRNQ